DTRSFPLPGLWRLRGVFRLTLARFAPNGSLRGVSVRRRRALGLQSLARLQILAPLGEVPLLRLARWPGTATSIHPPVSTGSLERARLSQSRASCPFLIEPPSAAVLPRIAVISRQKQHNERVF